MATVTEITQVLEQVQQLSAGMLKELETGTAEVGSFSAKAQQLSRVITSISAMVPTVIYSNYQEFFDSFKDFCGKCKEEDFLIENVDNMASSLDLFGECLGAMAGECTNRIKTCVCCGHEVVYQPLPDYYKNMKEKVGDYRESLPETLNTEEYLCPRCGSSDRDRLILSFLMKLQIDRAMMGERLLHIAPARTIEQWIQGNCMSLTYHSTDLFMNGVTFTADIQDMNQVETGYYDYFICSHVLEHVQNDRKAMGELHRILKNDGIGLFLVPLDLKVEQTDEEWGLSEEENWRRFGQGDHCRKYAKTDLLERLEEAGFCVHELGKEYFGEEIFRQCGLTDTSILYVLTKEEVSLETLIKEKAQKRGDFVKPQPLVSVILPCYNHAKYVAEAIESVINQSYPNIEILVADDASTDNSVEIIKKYSPYLTKELYYETNKGGRVLDLLEHAQGKYIALMHSDDIWDKDKIALQVEYLEAHSECGICFTWCKYIDENYKELQDNIFIKGNRNSHEWMRFFWEYGNAICNPSLLVRREYAKDYPKYGSMCRQIPDFFRWVNLVQKMEIYIVPKVLIKMRRLTGAQNMSAPSQENAYRHLVEEGSCWMWIIREMPAEFFKKAFAELMVNPHATTEQQIKCEKYFLLLKHKNMFVQNSAFTYLAENFDEMIDVLVEEYQYTRRDVAKDLVDNGIVKNLLNG